jgi:hypothetical protein
MVAEPLGGKAHRARGQEHSEDCILQKDRAKFKPLSKKFFNSLCIRSATYGAQHSPARRQAHRAERQISAPTRRNDNARLLSQNGNMAVIQWSGVSATLGLSRPAGAALTDRRHAGARGRNLCPSPQIELLTRRLQEAPA